MFGILTIIWIIRWNKQIIFNLRSLILSYPTIFAASALFLLGATISLFTAVDFRAALGEWKSFYVEPVVLFVMLLTITHQQANSLVSKKNKGRIKIKELRFFSSPTPVGISPTGSTIFSLQSSVSTTIVSALLLCGIATSLLAIYQHFTGWMVPYDFWENRQTYRVTAWYGFPNGVGLFLAPVFVLGVYKFVKFVTILKNKKLEIGNWKLFFALVSIFIFLISIALAIIYAKSTGAIIGIAAAIGFLLLIWKRTRWFALTAGIIAMVGLFSLPTDNAIRQEILMQDRSGQLRVEMWAETSAYLMKHPIVGTGLASYEERIAPYRIRTNIEIFHHPHNLLLTIWVNTGILGLLGFVWLLVAIFNLQSSIFLQTKKLPHLNIFLLATLITILTMGLVDSPYIKNDLAFLFWTVLALLVISSYEQKNMENKTA